MPIDRFTLESRGNGDVIELLRARGADPNATNNSGVSPVELARTIANFDVAQFYDDVATWPAPSGRGMRFSAKHQKISCLVKNG